MALTYPNYSMTQPFDSQDDEERKRREQEELALAQSGFPTQGPISPETFNQTLAPETTMMPMPEPSEGTQFAGPVTPGSLQQTAQPMQQPMMQQPAQQMVQQQQAQPQVTPFQQLLTESQNDQKKLFELYNNPQYTPQQRQIAGAQLSDLMRQEYEKERATQFIKTSTPQDLNKMLNARTGEGSWAKAIMFGMLGMENSARDEAAKLGVGAKWQTQQVFDEKTGQTSNVLFKVRADGLPMEGYNAETGKALTSRELANLAGGTQKLNIVGGSYVNDKTGEIGRMVTDEKTGRTFIQTDTGRKPMAGFRPQSSAGSLDMQRIAQIQRQNIDLAGDWEKLKMKVQGAAPEAANRFLGEFNAKFGTNYNLSNLSGSAPQISLETGRMIEATPTQAPAAMPTQAPAAMPTQAPAAMPTQAPSTQAAPSVSASATPSGGVKLNVGPQPSMAPSMPSAAPVAAGGGAISGLSNRPSTMGMATPAGAAQALEVGTAAAKQQIEVAGARSQSFNKILDEEVRPQAQAGDTVSSVRKQQFAIFNRPGIDVNKLFGLYNAAQEAPGDQKLSILRDIFGGVFKPENEVSQRLANLNLTPDEKAALMEYNIANQKINAATLKQTAGAGSVSDAEQKANRESNVDPTKIPALGAYNAMAQSQFDGDRARYKADWALRSPATNALQLDREWRKESQRLSQIYVDMAKKRNQFIVQNGSTTNAVREGYRRFPVPEYDPATETWKKTKPLDEIMGR